MSGFKASERISSLSYDFRGITVADDDAQELLDGARGVTPEPSPRQVRHMQARQREVLGLSPDTTPEEANKVMAGKDEAEWNDIDDDVLDMIAELTNGSPSREELAVLPFRVQQSYYGWLLGELNSPSIGTSGSTRPSLAPVRTASR